MAPSLAGEKAWRASLRLPWWSVFVILTFLNRYCGGFPPFLVCQVEAWLGKHARQAHLKPCYSLCFSDALSWTFCGFWHGFAVSSRSTIRLRQVFMELTPGEEVRAGRPQCLDPRDAEMMTKKFA